MGRALGSPNLEYRWEFTLYHPITGEIIHTQKYTTIKTMQESMNNFFTLSQLTSYASKRRKCPKMIEIKRICEPVHSY